MKTLKPAGVAEIIIQSGAKTSLNNIEHYCALLGGIFRQDSSEEYQKEIVLTLDLNILASFNDYA